MEARFVNYNCLVTYMGELDKELFQETLIDAIGLGPKFIPRISDDISLLSYNSYNLCKINIVFFIERGIFSEEEKAAAIKTLRDNITAKIQEGLKTQKIIFILDVN